MIMSYYKEIDGKKYDGTLLEAAEKALAGQVDGRIAMADSENLYKVVRDGDTCTDFEKETVHYIRENMNWIRRSQRVVPHGTPQVGRYALRVKPTKYRKTRCNKRSSIERTFFYT